MSSAHRSHRYACITRAVTRAHCSIISFIISFIHYFIYLLFQNATFHPSFASSALAAASLVTHRRAALPWSPFDPSSTRASSASSSRRDDDRVARASPPLASAPTTRRRRSTSTMSPRRDSSPPRSRSRSRRRPRRCARFRRRPSAPRTRAMGACATTRGRDEAMRETRRLRVGFSRLTARRRARAILSNARAGTITVEKISRARVNISPRVR